MRIGIGITTAPRHVPTLSKSVQTLRQAGCDEWLFVSSDGPCQLDDEQAVTRVNDPVRGVLHNWFWTLEWLLEQPDNFDWLLILQDDAGWSLNGWPVLLDELVIAPNPKQIGFISLYLHRTTWNCLKKWKIKSPGIHGILKLGRTFDGALGLAFPRSTAEVLARNPKARQWSKNRNVDNVVGLFLEKKGYVNYHRIPSLVNHKLGSKNSTIKVKKSDDTPIWSQTAQKVEWK